MRIVHEFLATVPFDIYELHLFHLVARYQSFTKAAEVAGLTQSAVTRQVQGIEESLGVPLFERTTRSVRLTPAGEMLQRESAQLLGNIGQTLKQIREEFTDARKVIRVGVSRSVGLAYLPGFFHANLQRLPQIGYQVSYEKSSSILSSLEANELDLGVFSPPPRLPTTLRITHHFGDTFVLISAAALTRGFDPASKKKRLRWAQDQNWLLIDEHSNTGKRLRAWMNTQGLAIEPGMQLDSFDLIINLVALGMGVSFVPIRALALYHRKRNLVRLDWPARFSRELVVAMRRNRNVPVHLGQFIDNVLF